MHTFLVLSEHLSELYVYYKAVESENRSNKDT
jgi:hypothetical protein